MGHSQVPGLAVPLSTQRYLAGAVLPLAETAVRWPSSSTTVTVRETVWSYPLPVVTDPPPAPSVPDFPSDDWYSSATTRRPLLTTAPTSNLTVVVTVTGLMLAAWGLPYGATGLELVTGPS
ncbi:hypothetical protein D9M69_658560 [compost metagenome]